MISDGIESDMEFNADWPLSTHIVEYPSIRSIRTNTLQLSKLSSTTKMLVMVMHRLSAWYSAGQFKS
jgi:hypothetical protein